MSILKKTFFFSLFVLLLALLLWGVYNLSFKNTSKNADTNIANQDKTGTSKGPSSAEAKKVAMVSQEAVIAPVLSDDGNSLDYFSQKSGQLMQADFYGNVQKTLSAKNIPGLLGAVWSIDRRKVIIKSQSSESSPVFSSLDIVSGENKPLKDNLDEVVWQTNANRILYKYFDSASKERTLNVSDPDGGNWAKIADLSYKNLSISQIPKTGLVSFWNTGDAYEQTVLQSMPLAGGEARTLISTGFGADYLWNASGSWVLVSRTNAQGGSKMDLGIMNANGGEYKSLSVPTFINKCVWSSDDQTIYYALPGGIPDNAVLPNDYRAGKFKTTDTFWKVNVKTGEKTRLVEIKDIGGQFDAGQLFINKSESLLFFVNKMDGKIYKITL